MGAVLYLRSTTRSTGHSHSLKVEFLMAKSKVAPLKRCTIPRLELGAAVLLTKLAAQFLKSTQLKISAIHLWTDSKVTLAWIQSQPSRWKEFVGNRVALIQELLPSAQWRHVSGLDNPADCASRGISATQLINHELWWHGPSWLQEDSTHWPTLLKPLDTTTLPEARPRTTLNSSINQQYSWDLIFRYSSLTRLTRITAWCRRACDKFRKRKISQAAGLTPEELKSALYIWIKHTQHVYFKDELKKLKELTLPKHHVLVQLTAFVDSIGVLRVGGRLSNAQMDYSTQHPAIIPRRSPLSTLIINQAHLETLHGGTQLTLARIRQQYWIIGGRAPVKSHILQCVTCTRFRARRAQQLMGQLPEARVNPSPPFSHTGIDYAGPLSIKSWKGRGSKRYKGWICIFVCFSTSAVHLELVSDYSSDGFIAALQRFISIRGTPSDLYSDCGTNFVGADSTLKDLLKQAQKGNSPLISSMTTQGIQWHFNPPAAPHMGGKWEAVVKSMKFHWRRNIGDTPLTFEEASTVLYQITAQLNSRPLEPLSEDPDDLNVLTPGHFLIGRPLNALPMPTLLNKDDSRLARWQLLQKLIQQFWKGWSTQYLQRAQAISKWHHPSNEIKIGSIVLLSDERTTPTQWPLARVLKVHPGKDGLARVATIKTATTQLDRPIAKLIVLPIRGYNQPSG